MGCSGHRMPTYFWDRTLTRTSHHESAATAHMIMPTSLRSHGRPPTSRRIGEPENRRKKNTKLHGELPAGSIRELEAVSPTRPITVSPFRPTTASHFDGVHPERSRRAQHRRRPLIRGPGCSLRRALNTMIIPSDRPGRRRSSVRSAVLVMAKGRARAILAAPGTLCA
jgi:hypothetical protein